VKCILGVKQLVYTYVSAAVGFPIIKQFKQCRSIPVAMLKIMHLATVQISPNGVEQRQSDFGKFQTVYTPIRCQVRDGASDLGLHCLNSLMVGNRTAALICPVNNRLLD
jgi:hypothetical protein